jgi:ribosome-binding protein aMBF1 (putative translation factor)
MKKQEYGNELVYVYCMYCLKPFHVNDLVIDKGHTDVCQECYHKFHKVKKKVIQRESFDDSYPDIIYQD